MELTTFATAIASLAVAALPSPPGADRAGALLRADATVQPAAIRAATWRGGPQTTPAGEVVTVYVSESYEDADARAVAWARFFTTLVHGPELSTVTAYVAPAAEIGSLCGNPDAAGCYGGRRLVFVGDLGLGIPPEAVAAHEYGHHIAASRSNTPWAALDTGPKRWASQVGVCARAGASTAFPGDEGANYTLNPGEGFAETYRVLNGVRAEPDPDWPIVDPSFRPDFAALEAARADVLEPWQAPVTQTFRARFRRGGPQRWTLRLSTRLDGDLRLELRLPAGAGYGLTLTAPGGRAMGAAARIATGREQLDARICGERALTVSVRRNGPPAAFRLLVTQP
jgi:hypothetical protein